jgi:predicted metalloendopeptidase
MRLCFLLPSVLFAAALSGQNVSHSGIHPEDMDNTCKPCTDFWRYVNRGWIDKNPIPDHAAAWGPFGVLMRRIRKEHVPFSMRRLGRGT